MAPKRTRRKSAAVAVHEETTLIEEPPGPGLTTRILRDREPFSISELLPSPTDWKPRQSRPSTSARSRDFLRRHFPGTGLAEWNDWKWQMRNRFVSIESLRRILAISPGEEAAIRGIHRALPVGITPYYASLIDPEDAGQPLRRTVMPVTDELVVGPGEKLDPLAEDAYSPVPGLVHRYPDRALFLVVGTCSVYCRYCTRSRAVGNPSEYRFGRTQWERALAYIEATPSIRDVLLSGGDPFCLSDQQLEYLLARLRRIPHVEFLRIGTKIPVVLPQRIRPPLVRMLRRYAPLAVSIHFTHPDELTPEVEEACTRLADAGIMLGSQTVLLKGINDDVHTMKRLFHGLLRIRVRPYYVYQCDPIIGSAHFRTPVEKAIELIEGLRGHTTGYAVPSFVIDAPGGGGKIPIQPQYMIGREGDDILLRNYEGKVFRYHDPLPPSDD
ncbi:MAG: KamA family radical SAM protein [Candidatus Eisenbacteria bacterium]|nr:KamA family radical SAM protein [Candidatus Eisenbacteria bacterium]